MTTPQQIANLVDRICTDIPRAHVAVHEGLYRQRPSAQDLSQRFFADVEFEALHLGRVLGTPDGELFQAVVALVFPPFAAADTKLIVDGLTLAAAAQSRRNRIITGTGLGLAAFGVGKPIFDAMKNAA